ncbi:MAG: nucleoside-diphosphate kinase [Prevotellaceae bacterium]|jgi:nucleoside-diphosphate kinase|nr:nucleoside-diphosphate kinase [Prevotellaceae bacterium]
MAGNITFSMIKPDAVGKGYTGKILDRFISEGFKIKAMRYTRLCKCEAETFYAVHKGKDFYEPLVEFMTSGPVVALVLEKENAVADYRTMIGATSNPAEGTVRHQFAESTRLNAVHGSDSDENAQIEAGFFFAQRELL